jgi:hypothetical protein
MTTVSKPKAGLEDTVATSSAICYLDGDRGVLAYCGFDIHDLARHATFEEVCFLLWQRRLPTRAELGDLQSQLIAARPLPEAVLRLMRALPAGNTMDALRTLTSALGHYDPDTNDQSAQANHRKAVRLTAQIASLVATMGRLNKGGGLIQPDPVLSHAANFLYMLTGDRPSALATRAFDVALILHADHELNASTFAARVAAATLTDIHSTIVGAIGALKGPLHGGANADVMRLLLEIGADAPPEKAEEVVRAKLARKEKIPRLRPSRLPHRGPAGDPSARDVARSRPARRPADLVRDVAAHRSAREGGEEAERERRFLFGVDLSLARHRHRSVHADLRGQPRLGLDRARARAVREQSADSPARRVHRPRVPAALPAARSPLTRRSTQSPQSTQNLVWDSPRVLRVLR